MRHVLHLMKPARPGGRGGDEGGPTGHDETGRGVAPKDTPHDASELNQVAVGRDFLIVQTPEVRYAGRVPLTLRPGDRFGLGLQCRQDAIPLLLDDIPL